MHTENGQRVVMQAKEAARRKTPQTQADQHNITATNNTGKSTAAKNHTNESRLSQTHCSQTHIYKGN
jgi:hypothetical protein